MILILIILLIIIIIFFINSFRTLKPNISIGGKSKRKKKKTRRKKKKQKKKGKSKGKSSSSGSSSGSSIVIPPIDDTAAVEAAILKAIADKAIADKAIADKADEAARLKAIADKAIADEAARLKAIADKETEKLKQQQIDDEMIFNKIKDLKDLEDLEDFFSDILKDSKNKDDFKFIFQLNKDDGEYKHIFSLIYIVFYKILNLQQSFSAYMFFNIILQNLIGCGEHENKLFFDIDTNYNCNDLINDDPYGYNFANFLEKNNIIDKEDKDVIYKHPTKNNLRSRLLLQTHERILKFNKIFRKIAENFPPTDLNGILIEEIHHENIQPSIKIGNITFQLMGKYIEIGDQIGNSIHYRPHVNIISTDNNGTNRHMFWVYLSLSEICYRYAFKVVIVSNRRNIQHVYGKGDDDYVQQTAINTNLQIFINQHYSTLPHLDHMYIPFYDSTYSDLGDYREEINNLFNRDREIRENIKINPYNKEKIKNIPTYLSTVKEKCKKIYTLSDILKYIQKKDNLEEDNIKDIDDLIYDFIEIFKKYPSEYLIKQIPPHKSDLITNLDIYIYLYCNLLYIKHIIDDKSRAISIEPFIELKNTIKCGSTKITFNEGGVKIDVYATDEVIKKEMDIFSIKLNNAYNISKNEILDTRIEYYHINMADIEINTCSIKLIPKEPGINLILYYHKIKILKIYKQDNTDENTNLEDLFKKYKDAYHYVPILLTTDDTVTATIKDTLDATDIDPILLTGTYANYILSGIYICKIFEYHNQCSIIYMNDRKKKCHSVYSYIGDRHIGIFPFDSPIFNE